LGTEIRIVDEQEDDLPPGQVGEILLRGSHVSPGYLNLEKETATAYRNGWLHSGDLGRFDEHGFLYIVDRKKDMIISGGFNIYSREVEMHLDSHPAILESAVIGLPDEKWGEACTACLVLKEKTVSPSTRDLIDHCLKEGLPKYKVPKLFLFFESLPKNENKKIIKKQLKEMALAGTAGMGPEQASSA
jgi:long-chain acyl-CoA synthetase